MSAIGGTFKRFVAVGCSHGHLADPKALEAVLKFCKTFKPHRRFHLGDFTDQAAFRSGAKGTKDETVSIADDLTHGLNFLRAYRPTDILNGNHEIRLWKLADHHNQMVSKAASAVITEIIAAVGKLKANYVQTYDINSSWIPLGDHKMMHGWMFSENALRDHCEHFGNVIMAHLHLAGEVAGRRSDHPKGYCVGTLANIPSMAYANTRRATARWSAGLVYGESNGKETHPFLSSAPHNDAANWRLPI